MLIVMAGLPGAGKSTVADGLGRARSWPVLSVDPVEAALLYSGIDAAQPTGLAAYVVVEAMAEHQLGLGQTVIVDAVNDAPEARQQWRDLAARAGVDLRWIEVGCSDPEIHRVRLAGRQRRLLVALEPDWASLEARRVGLAEWTDDRLRIDSVADPQTSLDYLVERLGSS